MATLPGVWPFLPPHNHLSSEFGLMLSRATSM